MNKIIFSSFELLEKPLTAEELQEQRRTAAKVILRGSPYWDKACKVIESEGIQKDADDYYYQVNRLILTWEMDDWIFGGL